MTSVHHSERHLRAAALLDQARSSQDGIQIVESLSAGLNTVRDLMFQRIHHDVERYFGMDSMNIPLSLDNSEYNAKAEIDIWQIVEVAEFVVQMGMLGDAEWARRWLGELRLGGSFVNAPVGNRVTEYVDLDHDSRRLHFSRSLEKVYPEARKSPLILYQLLPHAVQIVTSVAFGATEEATRQREHQKGLLPAIADCRSCKGLVLDNGETCEDCANPVWNYKWLLADD